MNWENSKIIEELKKLARLILKYLWDDQNLINEEDDKFNKTNRTRYFILWQYEKNRAYLTGSISSIRGNCWKKILSCNSYTK